MRKRTLRKLPEVTRKYARLLDDLQSVIRRGRNLIQEIQSLEIDSKALTHVKDIPQSKEPVFDDSQVDADD